MQRIGYQCNHYFVLSIFAGAAVTVNMTCNSGHKETWASSSIVGRGKWSMPSINLLIIVYTFVTGLRFDQLKVHYFNDYNK